jgi:hypothetical protein
MLPSSASVQIRLTLHLNRYEENVEKLRRSTRQKHFNMGFQQQNADRKSHKPVQFLLRINFYNQIEIYSGQKLADKSGFFSGQNIPFSEEIFSGQKILFSGRFSDQKTYRFCGHELYGQVCPPPSFDFLYHPHIMFINDAS